MNVQKVFILKQNPYSEVRNKLKDRNYNIEYIQALDGAHLNYEKQSENFKLENCLTYEIC